MVPSCSDANCRPAFRPCARSARTTATTWTRPPTSTSWSRSARTASFPVHGGSARAFWWTPSRNCSRATSRCFGAWTRCSPRNSKGCGAKRFATGTTATTGAAARRRRSTTPTGCCCSCRSGVQAVLVRDRHASVPADALLERHVDPAALNDLTVGDAGLAAFDIRHAKTEALLFQPGYLTILPKSAARQAISTAWAIRTGAQPSRFRGARRLTLPEVEGVQPELAANT